MRVARTLSTNLSRAVIQCTLPGLAAITMLVVTRACGIGIAALTLPALALGPLRGFGAAWTPNAIFAGLAAGMLSRARHAGA